MRSKTTAIEEQLKKAEEAKEKAENTLKSEAEEKDKTLEMLKKKSEQRYQRLQKELRVYRDSTTKTINRQTEQLSVYTEKIEKLEDEIASGKPGEKRMFELAAMQARRDNEIDEQRTKVEDITAQLEDYEKERSKHEAEKAFLIAQYRK